MKLPMIFYRLQYYAILLVTVHLLDLLGGKKDIYKDKTENVLYKVEDTDYITEQKKKRPRI